MVSAYSIGHFWRRRIGTVVGTGEVIGVPFDETLNISNINSSTIAFVEIVWRWYAVRKVLSDLEDYDQLYDNIGRFLDLVHRLDPATEADVRYSWWSGLIEGW